MEVLESPGRPGPMPAAGSSPSPPSKTAKKMLKKMEEADWLQESGEEAGDDFFPL